jgi:hypothetical protein
MASAFVCRAYSRKPELPRPENASAFAVSEQHAESFLAGSGKIDHAAAGG